MNAHATASRAQHLGRYRSIIAILIKYGFEDFIANSALRKLVPRIKRFVPKRDGQVVFDYSRYERIRLALEELGPTFIKFGQILSNRPDILPEELIDELEKLQDEVPPFSESITREKLEVILGKELGSVLESMDNTPLASGSIAQIHRAVLKDGRNVVFKIQRPSIKKVMYEDIDIMKDLAGIAEQNFSDLAMLNLSELVVTFERTLRRELDFMTEAANMKRFKKIFADDNRIHTPEVFGEYTSRNVICMEYIDGMKITDLEALKAKGINPKQLAADGIDLYFKQVFNHGFFHADPHPGNIFILNDGRFCFIDFGMMGTLMQEDQEILGDLLYYVHEKNVEKLTKTIQQFSKGDEIENLQDFKYRVEAFVNELDIVSVDDVDMTEVVSGLQELMFEYKLNLPRNFHLLLRALMIIDGVGLYLDPQYKIMEQIQPYAVILVKRKFDPVKMLDAAADTVIDFAKLANNFPADVKSILTKAKKGKLHFQFEHKGLKEFYHTMDVVSNRISFSILVASLIIGSSLLMVSKVPPLYKEIPLLGLIGFVISFFLALRLALSILRHGKF